MTLFINQYVIIITYLIVLEGIFGH